MVRRSGSARPYSPKTGLFYVSVREIGSIYYKREADYKPGTFFAGGGEAGIPNGEKSGAIRALEVTTGKMRWEFPLHTASWSGVLSTGGGLVFSGSDEGNFFALDAQSGKPLWDFQTGGAIASNPVAFTVDGKQCVRTLLPLIASIGSEKQRTSLRKTLCYSLGVLGNKKILKSLIFINKEVTFHTTKSSISTSVSFGSNLSSLATK